MEYVILLSILAGVLFAVLKNRRDAGKRNPLRMFVYNCSKQQLEEAISATAGKLRWKVEKMDVQRGRIKLGVGMSWRSFGEWVHIQLIEDSHETTKLIISCHTKSGSEVYDKNHRNVETFLDCLDETIPDVDSEGMAIMG